MPTVQRTGRAERDLAEIFNHVATENPHAADRLIRDIAARCDRIAPQPLSGRLRSELAPSLRSMSCGSYIIFYLPYNDGILVVRVLHGARDIAAEFARTPPSTL